MGEESVDMVRGRGDDDSQWLSVYAGVVGGLSSVPARWLHSTFLD